MNKLSPPVSSDSEDDAVIGRALRISVLVIACIVTVIFGWFAVRRLFTRPPEKQVVAVTKPELRKSLQATIPSLPLADITEEAGIDFVHQSGAEGQKLLPETMGSGVAWIDYDNDGDQDLLLVDSTAWEWSSSRSASGGQGRCRLYANDGRGGFTDVSDETGFEQTLYGMGVAIGDYDNDGWTDIFLSAVGHNRLLRNEEGQFRDVTDEAGVAGAGDAWSTSCGFVDYDNDGRLDLMVCNYVRWSKEIDLGQSFSLDGETRAYGPPRAFGGTFPYLYRNEGDGRFADVSASAGVQIRNRNTGVPLSKGMGLAPVDVNADGFIDLVVANDTVQNFLFVNQKDGTFSELGEELGIAYDRDGNARGAMGIDAAVYRGSDTVAIGIGNFANEPSALYVAKAGSSQFSDLAMATGFGPPTRSRLTFGLFFFDVDLDGRLDVAGANGHLEEEIHKVQSTQHHAQPPQLFWNAGASGGSQLVQVPPEKTGEAFHQPMVGRGAAFADIDGDGDLDFILTANGGPPRLLRNDQTLGHHWLRLKLVGRTANRSAIGARVEVEAGDQVLVKTVMPTRSYLSQCELPVTFGLGEATSVDSVTITWPGGKTQQVQIDAVDQEIEVVEEA